MSKRTPDRACRTCGINIAGAGRGQRYCSGLCRAESEREYSRRYREKNREVVRARTARWRASNRDKLLEDKKRWYWENREMCLERARKRGVAMRAALRAMRDLGLA